MKIKVVFYQWNQAEFVLDQTSFSLYELQNTEHLSFFRQLSFVFLLPFSETC